MKKLLFILLLLDINKGAAQTPVLAADINVIDSSTPAALNVWNNTLYFYAGDGVHGRELYSYNETIGAALVADICPGSCSASSFGPETNMASLNGKLYFAGAPQSGVWQLYEYDGGHPAALVGGATFNRIYDPYTMVEIGGKLYFAADSGFWGYRLWIYDGANQPVETNLRDPGDQYVLFQGKIYLNSGYDHYLTAFDPANNTSNTITTASNSSDFSMPDNIIADSTSLYFTAFDTAGLELYSYDGNVAKRLTNIAVGAGQNGAIGPLAYYKGAVYFAGSTDGINYQLYKYNAGHASLVATINLSGDSYLRSMIVYKGALYFTAVTASAGRELWKFDGASASMVADLSPGPGSGLKAIGSGADNNYHFAILNDHLYFPADDGIHGTELFRLNDNVGIQRVKWSANVTVYPNPAYSVANLGITVKERQQVNVTLMDDIGKIAYKIDAQNLNSGSNSIALPVEHLPTGQYIYLITSTDNARLASGAIIKQ